MCNVQSRGGREAVGQGSMQAGRLAGWQAGLHSAPGAAGQLRQQASISPCPQPPPLLPCSPPPPAALLQLERMGHLYAATPQNLAQVVAGMDPARLAPYDKGDPAGIVQHIDCAIGVRRKPL